MDARTYLERRWRRLRVGGVVAICGAFVVLLTDPSATTGLFAFYSVMLILVGWAAIEYALYGSVTGDERMKRIEALLTRIADAVAPIAVPSNRDRDSSEAPKIAVMVRPGNWYVELDDGTGAGRHAEIDGAVPLEAGEVLQGRLYERQWRIDRVEPDRQYAHAVPHE